MKLSTQCFALLCLIVAVRASAEVQISLELAMPALSQGGSGAFTVSANSGPAADGEGTVLKSYPGILKFGFAQGTGRYGALGSFERHGIELGNLQLFQSFISPNFFAVASAGMTCPSATNYNWMLVRLRSNDDLRNAMDASHPALRIGGTLSYDPTANPVFTSSSTFNLTGPDVESSNFSLSGYSGATCNNGVLRTQASRNILDTLGTMFFGDGLFAYISYSGNPSVALGLPVENLTGGAMSALHRNAFVGLYTQFTSRSTQNRHVVQMFPDAAGTTFTLKTVADVSNPLANASLGTLTCTTLNTPLTGFCSGTLALDGVEGTGKATCLYGSTPSPTLACVAQNPATPSIPISLVARISERSVLSVSVNEVLETSGPGQSDATSATLTNLSGRRITAMANPVGGGLGLSAPFSNTGAYQGSSSSGGTCGSTLDAFGTCTVSLQFNPSAYGVFAQTFRVAYDTGASTQNAIATVRGASGLTSIAVSPSTGFTPSSTQQLTATATFTDFSTQDITSVADWTSDSPTIATVDSTGLATMTAAGGSVTFQAALGSVNGSAQPTVGLDWQGTVQFGAAQGSYGAMLRIFDIKIDGSNNRYVFGNVGGRLEGQVSSSGNDVFVQKYNSSGTLQWTAQLGTHTNSFAEIVGGAVDSGGNAYIVANTGIVTGFYVGKVNSSGVIQRFQLYGDSQTRATGIAASGTDIYIVGTTTSATFNGVSRTGWKDLFVLKQDSDGTELWTKLLGASTGMVDVGHCAVDGSGNVYVTGRTNMGLSGNSQMGVYDFYLVKYTSAGVWSWTKQIGISGGTAYLRDVMGVSVAVDSDSDVYATGFFSTDSGTFDGHSVTANASSYYFLKYTSAGAKTWSAVISGTYLVNLKMGRACLDSAQNLYTVGLLGNGNSRLLDGVSGSANDAVFVKYSTDGAKQWVRRTPAYTADACAIDGNNKVFVGGATYSTVDGQSVYGQWDALLYEYSTAGTKQSTTLTHAENTRVLPAGIARAEDGVYVVGSAQSGFDGGTVSSYATEVYVTKYSLAGNREWTRFIGGSGQRSVPTAMAARGGYVYAAGEATETFDGNEAIGYSDTFLVKYAADGTKVWSTQVASGGTPNGMVVDADGNIYVSGSMFQDFSTHTLAGWTDFYLLKFDAAGSLVWSRTLGVADSGVYWAYVGLGGDGSLYVTGSISGTNFDGQPVNDAAGFVAKFNNAGTHQWTKSLNTTGLLSLNGVVVNSSNELFLGGSLRGEYAGIEADGDYTILIKLDSSGDFVWARALGEDYMSFFTPGNLALDSAGNPILAGKMSGGFNAMTPIGGEDLLLVKYNSAGTLQWARQFGVATGSVKSGFVSVGPSDALFVTGEVTAGIDGNSLIGTLDAFISKFSSAGVLQ